MTQAERDQKTKELTDDSLADLEAKTARLEALGDEIDKYLLEKKILDMRLSRAYAHVPDQQTCKGPRHTTYGVDVEDEDGVYYVNIPCSWCFGLPRSVWLERIGVERVF